MEIKKKHGMNRKRMPIALYFAHLFVPLQQFRLLDTESCGMKTQNCIKYGLDH